MKALHVAPSRENSRSSVGSFDEIQYDLAEQTATGTHIFHTNDDEAVPSLGPPPRGSHFARQEVLPDFDWIPNVYVLLR